MCVYFDTEYMVLMFLESLTNVAHCIKELEMGEDKWCRGKKQIGDDGEV